MSAKQTTVFLSIIFVSALLFSACLPNTTSETSLESTSNINPSEGGAQQEMVKVVATEGEYESPAGEEKVGFALTVDDNGVISNVETEVLATAPISVMRQESFAKELPSVLVGKKLMDLESIDRVGGSSLTTASFNEALVDLKAQL
jgi:hypothetical protein